MTNTNHFPSTKRFPHLLSFFLKPQAKLPQAKVKERKKKHPHIFSAMTPTKDPAKYFSFPYYPQVQGRAGSSENGSRMITRVTLIGYISSAKVLVVPRLKIVPMGAKAMCIFFFFSFFLKGVGVGSHVLGNTGFGDGLLV